MKKIIGLLAFVVASTSMFAQSQKSVGTVEKEVKRLDSLHAVAVLSGDLKEMDKYWTEDFMVTNPFNEIDRADRVRSGAMTYASFQRISEAIRIHDNTAIVMGKEIVVPKGKSPNAGQTINRRYTNIWMKRDGQWRLVARQASNICIQ